MPPKPTRVGKVRFQTAFNIYKNTPKKRFEPAAAKLVWDYFLLGIYEFLFYEFT
jgi:hypothetical protein